MLNKLLALINAFWSGFYLQGTLGEIMYAIFIDIFKKCCDQPTFFIKKIFNMMRKIRELVQELFLNLIWR